MPSTFAVAMYSLCPVFRGHRAGILSLQDEESARTLDVLGVDGQKERFNVKNTPRRVRSTCSTISIIVVCKIMEARDL